MLRSTAGRSLPSAPPDPAIRTFPVAGAGAQMSGRIKVVLTRNPHERELGVASGKGQRRPHAARIGGLSHVADRPVRGDPLARIMGQHEIDHTHCRIDGGRLRIELLLREWL